MSPQSNTPRLLSIALFIFATAGCGVGKTKIQDTSWVSNRGGQQTEVQNPIQYTTSRPLTEPGSFSTAEEFYSTELSTRLQAIRLNCGTTRCPQAVGTLYTLTNLTRQESSSFLNVTSIRNSLCNGTLIGPNLVLTASHCIPPEIKQNPALCASRMGFKTTGRNGQGVAAPCARIEYAGQLTFNNSGGIIIESSDSDLAIIRLARSLEVDVPQYSQAPLADESAITIRSFDQGSTGMNITLRTSNCSIVQGSVLGMAQSAPLGKYALIGGQTEHCRVIRGNSGSGIFNAQGQLIGVVSAVDDNSAAASLRRFRQSRSSIFDSYAYIAMLNCANAPGVGLRPNSGCPSGAPANPFMAQVSDMMNQHYQEHQESLRDGFAYHTRIIQRMQAASQRNFANPLELLRFYTSTFVFQSRPRCKISNSLSITGASSESVLNEETLTFTGDLDDRMRPSNLRANRRATGIARLRITGNAPNYQFAIVRQPVGASPVVESLQLPECSDNPTNTNEVVTSNR